MLDLNNGNWRQFKDERTKALGVWPNQLWRNGEAGALVVMKSSTYAEYALSKSGLDYMLAALQAGRISTGSIALANWQAGKLTIVATKPAHEVAAAVEGITPRNGDRLGPYWWMKADLTPDGANALGSDEEF
jgi:hypothetical protein